MVAAFFILENIMTGQVVYQPEVVPLRWFIADDKGDEVSR